LVDEKEPTGHDEQLGDPAVFAYVPGEQEIQRDPFPADVVPAEHDTQDDTPREVEIFPAGQRSQLEDPEEGAYVPIAHCEQFMDDSDLLNPVAHGMHALVCPPEK
jgi:hypothetical protein